MKMFYASKLNCLYETLLLDKILMEESSFLGIRFVLFSIKGQGLDSTSFGLEKGRDSIATIFIFRKKLRFGCDLPLA